MGDRSSKQDRTFLYKIAHDTYEEFFSLKNMEVTSRSEVFKIVNEELRKRVRCLRGETLGRIASCGSSDLRRKRTPLRCCGYTLDLNHRKSGRELTEEIAFATLFAALWDRFVEVRQESSVVIPDLVKQDPSLLPQEVAVPSVLQEIYFPDVLQPCYTDADQLLRDALSLAENLDVRVAWDKAWFASLIYKGRLYVAAGFCEERPSLYGTKAPDNGSSITQPSRTVEGWLQGAAAFEANSPSEGLEMLRSDTLRWGGLLNDI